MESKIEICEVIQFHNHQINIYFLTRKGNKELAMVLPLNLFTDEYAIEKFDNVIESVNTEENGQYYVQLVSNMRSKGLILKTSKMISMEAYTAIISTIISRSHHYVKNINGW